MGRVKMCSWRFGEACCLEKQQFFLELGGRLHFPVGYAKSQLEKLEGSICDESEVEGESSVVLKVVDACLDIISVDGTADGAWLGQRLTAGDRKCICTI